MSVSYTTVNCEIAEYNCNNYGTTEYTSGLRTSVTCTFYNCHLSRPT